jgi:hypothetical protein
MATAAIFVLLPEDHHQLATDATVQESSMLASVTHAMGARCSNVQNVLMVSLCAKHVFMPISIGSKESTRPTLDRHLQESKLQVAAPAISQRLEISGLSEAARQPLLKLLGPLKTHCSVGRTTGVELS